MTYSLATIFLKHKLRLWKMMSAVVLIFGILLVVQPPFIFGSADSKSDSKAQNSTNGTSENDDPNVKHNDMYYIGALIGLCAAIAGGLLNVTVNFCKEIHSFVLLWWSGIGHSV